MGSIERRKAPSLSRFDSLPLNWESIRARSEYLGAYEREVAPLVSQRAKVGVELEMAAQRLRSMQIAEVKDETIRRLQAELLAMGSDRSSFGAVPIADSNGMSEAQAAYGALEAQTAELDAQIGKRDAELLAGFGLA